MSANSIDETVHSLHVVKETDIAASLEIAFEAVLAEMGPEGQMPDGTPFPMQVEPWPGGRWYRDLGNNSGHFWGHVQVIKPPKLLEICGPMFMSYPVMSHVQYRLEAQGNGTRLTITHRAAGQIPSEHREGVNQGWKFKLDRMREIAERLAARR